jgi:hypothetical protein
MLRASRYANFSFLFSPFFVLEHQQEKNADVSDLGCGCRLPLTAKKERSRVYRAQPATSHHHHHSSASHPASHQERAISLHHGLLEDPFSKQ